MRCTAPPRFLPNGIRFVAYEYEVDHAAKMEVPRNFVGKLWDFGPVIAAGARACSSRATPRPAAPHTLPAPSLASCHPPRAPLTLSAPSLASTSPPPARPAGRALLTIDTFNSTEFFIDVSVFVAFMRRLDEVCFQDGQSIVGKILVRYCGVGNIPRHTEDIFCLDFAFFPTQHILELLKGVLSEFPQRVSVHWGKYRHPSWLPYLLPCGKAPPAVSSSDLTMLPEVSATPAWK